MKLRRELLQPVRRSVDGKDGSGFAFLSCEDRAEPARVLDFEFHLRPEVTAFALQSHAESPVGTACQIGSPIAVEGKNLRPPGLFRRVEQSPWRSQLAILALKQHERFAFAEHHDVVALVSVEVARRENLRRCLHALNGCADTIPFSFRLLQLQNQPVRRSPVGQVRLAVPVEVARDEIRNRLVDNQFLMCKQHRARECIDVACHEFRLPVLGLSLQKDVNPAVPVIGSRQVDPPVAVEIAMNQIRRAILNGDHFQRQESVKGAEVNFVRCGERAA